MNNNNNNEGDANNPLAAAVDDDLQDIRARFATLLASLYGNQCRSLTLDTAADPELCAFAPSQIERLVEALYANQSLYTVKISAYFLDLLSRKEQEQLLSVLWNVKTVGVCQLGVDGEPAKLSMKVLVQSLKDAPLIENPTQFIRLTLKAMVIQSPDEVVEVAQGMRQLNRVFNTTQVYMGPFVLACQTQQVPCILDPLVDLLAEMVQAHHQVLQVQSYNGTTPLISAEAAQRLMTAFQGNTETTFQRGFPSALELKGLGLDDLIMESMATAIIQSPHHLGEIYLQDNASISFDSLERWLRVIDYCPNLTTVQCGIEDWDATIKLHVKLNGLGRREAIEDGLYSDRSVWCDWLAKLANVERLVQKFHFERYCRNSDALVVSSLFLTVRNQPNFVQ